MPLRLLLLCLCILAAAPSAEAAKPKKSVDCLSCHRELGRGKSVHAAVTMGCDSCHTALDAGDVPHRITNKKPRGLSDDLPALCYGCHDKALFTKRIVHPALAMGCTVCHNPHASNAASLLVDPVGKLCTGCHEKQASGRHVMAGFSTGDDHPLRGRTDPVRTSRELSCVSCHNPHSSSQQKLFVNETDSTDSVCRLCHKKISLRTDKP